MAFDIDGPALANDSTFAAALKRGFHSPAGPVRTTAASRGRAAVGVTTWSLSDAMQGRPIYKPELLNLSNRNQTLSSDLRRFLESGGGSDLVLGARAGLLNSDILTKRGYDDGRFSGGGTGTGGAGTSSGGQIQGADGKVFPLQEPFNYQNDWGNPRSGGRTHKGTDIMAGSGTIEAKEDQNCYAITSGTIQQAIMSDDGNGGGIRLLLNGDDGDSYYYMHNSQNLVGEGDTVEVGQTIAKCGSTGNATAGGEHIHFEVHPGGYVGSSSATNPYPILQAIEQTGTRIDEDGSPAGPGSDPAANAAHRTTGQQSSDLQHFKAFLEEVSRLDSQYRNKCRQVYVGNYPRSQMPRVWHEVYMRSLKRIYDDYWFPWKWPNCTSSHGWLFNSRPPERPETPCEKEQTPTYGDSNRQPTNTGDDRSRYDSHRPR